MLSAEALCSQQRFQMEFFSQECELKCLMDVYQREKITQYFHLTDEFLSVIIFMQFAIEKECLIPPGPEKANGKSHP